MNIILIEPAEIGADGTVCLAGPRHTHVRGVLGAAAGDTIRVGVIDGPRGEGVVTSIDDEAVRLSCTFEASAPERPDVDLLLAMPRPKVLRRLWAQLAAIGVGRIILTNAERVERDYFGAHFLDESIFRPLLIEGLQQARDTRVPLVTIHRRFKILIEDELDALCGDAARLIAHPGAGASIASTLSARPSRALIAVGPEGGWNAFELDLLRAHGFAAVDMGVRTLRSDTACIALLTLVHEAMSRVAPG